MCVCVSKLCESKLCESKFCVCVSTLCGQVVCEVRKLCVRQAAAGGRRRKQAGVHNQKQEPRTKMWGRGKSDGYSRLKKLKTFWHVQTIYIIIVSNCPCWGVRLHCLLNCHTATSSHPPGGPVYIPFHIISPLLPLSPRKSVRLNKSHPQGPQCPQGRLVFSVLFPCIAAA